MTMTASPHQQKHTNPSPAVIQLLQEASRALSVGHHDSAQRLLDQALQLAPGNTQAHRLMGIAALMVGDHPKAINNLRSALAGSPDDAVINMTLGSALVETGATEAGLAHLQRACELAPKSAEPWYNLGVALKFASTTEFASKLEQARDALERAVTIDPGHIKARSKLATVMLNLGDMRAAASMLRGTLSRQPDCLEAWSTLGNLKTEPLNNEDVRRLQGLLCRPGLPDDSRIPLTFTLAKALEDQFDYAAAFDTICTANALKRRQLAWNQDEERARVDAIAQTFSRPMSEAPDATLGKEVIFVVCLPRSGATLTEQILASHPQVQGGGETRLLINVLNDESNRRGQPFFDWSLSATSMDWQRLGEDYLERTRKLREQHPRFTDKSVDNWAFVGAALAMLPGARIVNSRRDPLETCFACYRQLFPRGASFAYDLDDMVDYYAGYERLSALWRQKFPRRYFDHQYESLQKSTEEQIRRLLGFCGLPFDPACLAFHQTRRAVLTISASQVREPLRQNTARGALYGAKLDPLRDKLRAAGVPVADM